MLRMTSMTFSWEGAAASLSRATSRSGQRGSSLESKGNLAFMPASAQFSEGMIPVAVKEIIHRDMDRPRLGKQEKPGHFRLGWFHALWRGIAGGNQGPDGSRPAGGPPR